MILGCYAGVQYLAVQLAFTFGADAKQNLLRKLGLALFSGGSYTELIPSFIKPHRSHWEIPVVLARYRWCSLALVDLA